MSRVESIGNNSIVNIEDVFKGKNIKDGIVFVNVGADADEWLNCICAIFRSEGISTSDKWVKNVHKVNIGGKRIDTIIEVDGRSRLDKDALRMFSCRFDNMMTVAQYKELMLNI